jgi:hypothetical protein
MRLVALRGAIAAAAAVPASATDDPPPNFNFEVLPLLSDRCFR